MPFAGFENFDDCVAKVMEKEGHDRETAEKICGKLQSEHEEKVEKAEEVFRANIRILDASNRIIEGIASTPRLDKEKEIVLTKAISEAVPNFMELPVMTVRHTERVAGLYEEVKILEDGKVYVRGKVKHTPDADDVWNDVVKGELNAFSIHGRRREKSGECHVNPGMRNMPCVTHKMYLDAITLCSQEQGYGKLTAVNPDAVVTSVSDMALVKAVFGDTFIKAEDTNSNLIHQVVDGAGKMEEEKQEEQIEKSDDDSPSKLDMLIEMVRKLIKKDEEVHTQIEKSEEEPEMEEKDEKVEKAEEPITKANLESLEDVMSKAVERMDTIEKALGEFESRIAKMEEETISKGSEVVVIVTEDKIAGGNAGALNRYQAGKE
jgi:hypothetical protein